MLIRVSWLNSDRVGVPCSYLFTECRSFQISMDSSTFILLESIDWLIAIIMHVLGILTVPYQLQLRSFSGIPTKGNPRSHELARMYPLVGTVLAYTFPSGQNP